jgi:hypothetical protein
MQDARRRVVQLEAKQERKELSVAGKLWRRGRELLPFEGFHFDRPLVVFQSDDWGRVGLRDQEGLEQLRSAGIMLGERPYDFYSLETAADLAALSGILSRHRDSVGRYPCLQMNFIVANLDFARMSADGFQHIYTRSLAEGLPEPWSRPGLYDAYREGIAAGIFHPAMHGLTHFCRAAVERNLTRDGERAGLLRTFWRAGTPYIHWRMPWIGYEYWDPEKPEEERFLPAPAQRELIGQAVGAFAKMFSMLPGSACAPGYRADEETNKAWAQHGIRVAQNGPGALIPPHFDYGILQLCRAIEFEPAVNPGLSIEEGLRQVEVCFNLGIPAIVSIHSINFHSTIKNFRGRTLQLLDEFLMALESKHADLLYLHDGDLYDIVGKGSYKTRDANVSVKIERKSFIRSRVVRLQA